MSLSVSIHHDLIRTLIKKYSGYEVKTIGDSFMIAFKDVNKATLLALDIQTLFYNSEWPSDIDATYAELISEAVSDDPKLAIAMMSCEEQYKQLWKGIRVRVGIHYGLGDIRKDPVSLGFDYYGTVVNTAARVEGVGHGGQVLLTEAAFDALDPTFVTKYKVQVIDLGMQPLRGLDTEVQLRQLLPSQFAGRRFPALRLDIEHVAIAEVENSDVSGSDTTDEILPPDQMAQRISNMPGMKIDPETILKYYNFLSVGFSAAPEKWCKGAIKELGKAWNVEVHHSPNSMMRGLMQMAIKMDRAARAKGGRRGSSNYTGSTKNGTEYLRANTYLTTPLVDPNKAGMTRQTSDGVSAFSVPASPAIVVKDERSPFEIAAQ